MVDLPHRIGKYTLHRRLGGGGMGDVYLATLQGAGGFSRDIAIKLMRAELAKSPHVIDLFLREGHALAALSHRNIVQVFELDAEDHQLYLAMEYLRGLDLRQLAARGPLAWPAAVYIAAEAARGLAAAHAVRSPEAPSGIVHGDVSPSNVMVCRDGAVKVLDFGIARPVGLVGGGVSGKLPYLPPEALVGAAPDERTDLYGLGIVLHELLTGERMFRARTEQEISHRVLHHKVAPPSAHAPGIPAALDSLVMSTINRDRAARPASGAELADALDRVLDGRLGAADLAELVGTLEDARPERSKTRMTPIGRTEVFASSGTAHTVADTPSGMADEAAPPAPVRARHGRTIAFAAIALLAVGAVAWQLSTRDARATPPPPVMAAPTATAREAGSPRATSPQIAPQIASQVASQIASQVAPQRPPAPAAIVEPAATAAAGGAAEPAKTTAAAAPAITSRERGTATTRRRRARPPAKPPVRASERTPVTADAPRPADPTEAERKPPAPKPPAPAQPPRDAAGSASLAPGYLANPFERK